jgi:hypothetical protein
MDGTGPQQPLSDSQLDRELESALGIEPSPEFLARVRTRITAEAEMSAWRLAIWGRGAQPVVVMAVAAVVLAVVLPTAMRKVKGPVPHATVAREVVVPGSERVESLPPADPPRPLRAVAAFATAPAPRPVEVDAVHTLPLQLSPVMFSEEDRIAFASFVTAVGDDRVADKVVQALGEEGMRSLAIAPLVINPLPSLARLEAQGEGQW